MTEALLDQHTAFLGSTTVDCLAPLDRYIQDGDHNHGGKEPMTRYYRELAWAAIAADLNGEASELQVHAGGGATNAAIVAAGMGERPVLVTVLGDSNLESQAIRHDLRDVGGLTLDVVAVRGFVPRLAMLIQASEAGKTQPNRTWYITEQPELNREVEDRLLKRFGDVAVGARVAYLGSVHPNLVRGAIEMVPSDVPVAFNPCSATFNPGVWPAGAKDVRRVVESGVLHHGYLGVNSDEIAAAWGYEKGLESARRAAREASRYVGHVLVTAGMEGAFAIHASNEDDYVLAECPPADVDDAEFKNNGGAGDLSFIGYLHAMLNGSGEDAALEKSREYAAMACRTVAAHVHPHELDLVS